MEFCSKEYKIANTSQNNHNSKNRPSADSSYCSSVSGGRSWRRRQGKRNPETKSSSLSIRVIPCVTFGITKPETKALKTEYVPIASVTKPDIITPVRIRHILNPLMDLPSRINHDSKNRPSADSSYCSSVSGGHSWRRREGKRNPETKSSSLSIRVIPCVTFGITKPETKGPKTEYVPIASVTKPDIITPVRIRHILNPPMDLPSREAEKWNRQCKGNKVTS
ncbi:unnamed protein product [Fraxinus pennsylvanica]|uniref:Uncharacterized protein n=1 Tax=Fraxinus pennsylvanica TaxID=56036 RepID=A0AAD2AA86_9LAMI|nr:unnamed protein product [Fraxinus pennsylvanica]